MLKKAVAVFFVCASIAIWIGCGSTSSHYVYATIPAANQVQVYREDPNSGVLTALTGSPFTAGFASRPSLGCPSKKFFYFSNPGASAFLLFPFPHRGAPPQGAPP